MSGQQVRHVIDQLNHDDLVGAPEGGGGVGPWVDFVPDPGWTPNTLRYRTVPAGLQFEGALGGSLGGGALARIGVLPAAYIPRRQQVAMHAVLAGVSYAWGFLVFQVNGDIITYWSVSGTQLIVSTIVALD